tara:strand:+ start:417 stop:806 length:390 start_codon:yes stop_codon:yes gene_type:complete
MKLFLKRLILLLTFYSWFIHATEESLITNKQINEIAVLAMTYASVSLACNEKKDADRLRQRLLSVLKLADKKRSLTEDGRAVLNDVSHHISMGVGIYRASPHVTCGVAKNYPSQIVSRIDQLLKANRNR